MTKLLIILGIIFVGVVILELFFGKRKKRVYEYRKKDFFMTRSEHEFFDTLISIIGNKYYIFAQVHLSTFLYHKIKKQNRLGAFSHINQKSVDFVLCDKSYISPKLVIELDDKTHERKSRILRDDEVNRILETARLPILRIKNYKDLDSNELLNKINSVILD